MFVSTSRLRTLAEYSTSETTASVADVETFMLILWEEATQAGRDAYSARLAETTPGEYPWSAVRPREYSLDATAWGELEKRIAFAPPALSLALARRPDIEPELAGDELPDPSGETPYQKILAAWWNWDPDTILESITPLGWTVPDDDLEISSTAVESMGELFAEPEDEPAPPIIPTVEGPATRQPASSGSTPARSAWDKAAPWVFGGGVLVAVGAGVYAVVTSQSPLSALNEGEGSSQ